MNVQPPQDGHNLNQAPQDGVWGSAIVDEQLKILPSDEIPIG